jgi:type I restriction-modification system DNA methylase subunit
MNQNQLTTFAQLEADLWEAADQLRANAKLTSSEYCMPVLGVIFLRHAYAQESNYTISRRYAMSLAIPGIEGNIAHGDRFYNDGHPDLRADYVLANLPFNDNDCRGVLLKDDKRWLYGVQGHDLVRAWRAAKNNGEVTHG